ncbi:hypothetical protein ACFSC6_14915 [Rufibacter sediminis]|uniref:DUF4234 domain-containing protein n=1 Tax=Rufibacter sediminis TaxID=2762756 RepID=A0ABR6VVW9_9BACT|nr:hypothetical protein [Rufibacter sediminis]MBC3541325.1 hypothetical protein [Rufibacter sediminis]
MELDVLANDDHFYPESSLGFTEEQQEIIEEYHQVLPAWKFGLLCFLSFNLYLIYWNYKNWYFIKEMEEREEIMPIWRAIFVIFFGPSLYKNVLERAQSVGYPKSYSPAVLFSVYVLITLLSRLPDPLWLLSLFSFLPLIPVLQARNYFFRKANPTGKTTSAFTGGEIIVVVLGAIFFALILVGLTVGETSY